MNLPNPPATYSRDDQSQLRTELAQESQRTLKKNADIDIGTKARLFLHSPDGSRFKIVVANDGTLSAVSAP